MYFLPKIWSNLENIELETLKSNNLLVTNILWSYFLYGFDTIQMLINYEDNIIKTLIKMSNASISQCKLQHNYQHGFTLKNNPYKRQS